MAEIGILSVIAKLRPRIVTSTWRAFEVGSISEARSVSRR